MTARSISTNILSLKSLDSLFSVFSSLISSTFKSKFKVPRAAAEVKQRAKPKIVVDAAAIGLSLLQFKSIPYDQVWMHLFHVERSVRDWHARVLRYVEYARKHVGPWAVKEKDYLEVLEEMQRLAMACQVCMDAAKDAEDSLWYVHHWDKWDPGSNGSTLFAIQQMLQSALKEAMCLCSAYADVEILEDPPGLKGRFVRFVQV